MLLMQDHTEVELGLRICRPQRDRLGICFCWLVELAMHLKEHADVVVGFGVIRFCGDGRPIGRDCFFETTLLLKRIAESQKSLGIIRLESYGVAVSSDRIIQLGLLLQHRSQIFITPGVNRPHLNLLSKQPLAAREIALLSPNTRAVSLPARRCASTPT